MGDWLVYANETVDTNWLLSTSLPNIQSIWCWRRMTCDATWWHHDHTVSVEQPRRAPSTDTLEVVYEARVLSNVWEHLSKEISTRLNRSKKLWRIFFYTQIFLRVFSSVFQRELDSSSVKLRPERTPVLIIVVYWFFNNRCVVLFQISVKLCGGFFPRTIITMAREDARNYDFCKIIKLLSVVTLITINGKKIHSSINNIYSVNSSIYFVFTCRKVTY